MSMNFEILAGSPLDEDCVQVSNDDYMPAMREELNKFKEMLEKRFAPILEANSDMRLKIKWESHDFGRYCEVAIYFPEYPEEDYDSEHDKGLENTENIDKNSQIWRIVNFMESHLPLTWSDIKVFTMDDVNTENEEE